MQFKFCFVTCQYPFFDPQWRFLSKSLNPTDQSTAVNPSSQSFYSIGLYENVSVIKTLPKQPMRKEQMIRLLSIYILMIQLFSTSLRYFHHTDPFKKVKSTAWLSNPVLYCQYPVSSDNRCMLIHRSFLGRRSVFKIPASFLGGLCYVIITFIRKQSFPLHTNIQSSNHFP